MGTTTHHPNSKFCLQVKQHTEPITPPLMEPILVALEKPIGFSNITISLFETTFLIFIGTLSLSLCNVREGERGGMGDIFRCTELDERSFFFQFCHDFVFIFVLRVFLWASFSKLVKIIMLGIEYFVTCLK